jgi:predicted alpha/beta-hydrolase family hydrolase
VSTGKAKRLTFAIDETRRISALLQLPRAAKACFVFAHSAGAGMNHPSMVAIAAELAA